MARINIDTSINKEQGFQDLLIFLGDRQKTKGMIWELFELAQEYYFPERLPIPKDVFKAKGFPDILYAPLSLCVEKEDGIYVRGSKERFAWLFQKSGAGKASGEARREASEKKSKEESEENRTDVEHPLTDVERTSTPANLLIPSSFLSSPSSDLQFNNSSLKSKTTIPRRKNSAATEDPTLGSLAFEEYAKAFLIRHKADIREIRDVKTNAMFKTLGKELGKDAPQVAAFYLTHNDFIYVKSKHCVDLLVRDAQKLWTEWKTGNKSTSHSARKSELEDHNDQVIEEYKKSKSSEGVPV